MVSSQDQIIPLFREDEGEGICGSYHTLELELTLTPRKEEIDQANGSHCGFVVSSQVVLLGIRILADAPLLSCSLFDEDHG